MYIEWPWVTKAFVNVFASCPRKISFATVHRRESLISLKSWLQCQTIKNGSLQEEEEDEDEEEEGKGKGKALHRICQRNKKKMNVANY